MKITKEEANKAWQKKPMTRNFSFYISHSKSQEYETQTREITPNVENPFGNIFFKAKANNWPSLPSLVLLTEKNPLWVFKSKGRGNQVSDTPKEEHIHTVTKKSTGVKEEINQERIFFFLGGRKSKNAYFFKLGRSLLTQRRRQDLPVLCRRPLDRMELQSLGPYFLTWLIRTSSSSAFHGPFFISPKSSYNLLLSIVNSLLFQLNPRIYLYT